MHKRSIFILIAIVALIGAVTISSAVENLPSPDAGQLWSYMTDSNPYQGWGFWPGYVGIYPGESPHGSS